MSSARHIPSPPASLLSRSPLAWLAVFGPGAVLASLSIGTGELIFSSRAGALFGERVLWLFLLTSVLKCVLVVSAARHMVLSGVHPFERWMDFPGPRGWLPLVLFLCALPAFPIWVGFHSGVIGTLFAGYVAGDHHVWGAVALSSALALGFLGGYRLLERVQLGVVIALLACVTCSLILLRPDVGEILKGLFLPGALRYPEWLPEVKPELADRPIWVESLTYVGVIGGAGFDYLAYVSYLRNKGWGFAGRAPASDEELRSVSRERMHPARRWVRAPVVDCAVSFLAVMFFSAVFVVCAKLVLAPQHEIPTEENLLNPQAEFLTRLHPWFLPLYVLGAALALFGTLYGTIEVAPAVLGEISRAFRGPAEERSERRLRAAALVWCGAGGFAVLAWSYLWPHSGATGRPPTLVEIVTPANLFTGILSCGFICLLNPWVDRRFLPGDLRMPRALAILNLLAGLVFMVLGAKGYWDYGVHKGGERLGGWVAILAIGAPLAAGCLAAKAWQGFSAKR